MRIEISTSVLSETQKATIVSRNEQLPSGNLYFEMSNVYAATLASMDGKYSDAFKVYPDKIFFNQNVHIGYQEGYNEKGDWTKLISDTAPAYLIADKYAKGEIQLGGSVDAVMETCDTIIKRKLEIQADNEHIEVIEKPKREAKEKADREARDAEYKRKQEEQKQADLARQIEKQAQHKKIVEWAQEHGSERFKKGLAQGHTCGKLFAIEYGAWLLNDSEYEYDYSGDVEEKDRSCPSLAALEEVERLQNTDGIEQAKVVWLPSGLQELHKSSGGYIEEPEDGCEAVRIDVKDTSGIWYKKF